MPRQIWVALLLVLGTSLCAFATTTDNDTEWVITSQAGSSISYNASTSGDVVGTGINVGSILGQLNGTTNATPAPLEMWGTMTFTSGAADPGTWNFGAGTLAINGCVAGIAGAGVVNGSDTGCTKSVLLMNATFANVQISATSTGMGAVMGDVAGTIDVAGIASHFGVSTTFVAPPSSASIPLKGLPHDPPFTNYGTFFTGAKVANGNGAATLYTAPEDSSLFSAFGIFGLGLAAFVLSRRFGLIKTVSF